MANHEQEALEPNVPNERKEAHLRKEQQRHTEEQEQEHKNNKVLPSRLDRRAAYGTAERKVRERTVSGFGERVTGTG